MDQNYNNIFGDIDLELLDLILKGHFENRKKILEVGCGEGRNLIYFLQKDFEVYAMDREQSAVDLVKYLFRNFNHEESNVRKCDIADTNYEEESIDAIICSRVLHFCENEKEFFKAWNEMHRILKRGGILYLSMDSRIGFGENVSKTDNGKWQFLDGSVRFLLEEELLRKMKVAETYHFISEIKTIHYGSRHAQTIMSLIKK